VNTVKLGLLIDSFLLGPVWL